MHPEAFSPPLCTCEDPAVRCPCAVLRVPAARSTCPPLLPPPEFLRRSIVHSAESTDDESDDISDLEYDSGTDAGVVLEQDRLLIRLLQAGVILSLMGERALHPLVILQVMPCVLQLDQPCRGEMTPYFLWSGCEFSTG